MRASGTKEWATHNANIAVGCPHECRYCYARFNAVTRFDTVKAEDWKNIKYTRIKNWPKVDGTIMFPTTHDIVPQILPHAIKQLEQMLKVGNNVLIVMKPHVECVLAICNNFAKYKKQILFRFTIGSYSDWVLKFWEPGAPSFEERYQSLRHAFLNGFKTSVSAEPLLDDPVRLYDILSPYITDALWIGKMNRIEERIDKSNWGRRGDKQLRLIQDLQTDEFIEDTYELMKHLPKIKWKQSYKIVLGLKSSGIGADE